MLKNKILIVDAQLNFQPFSQNFAFGVWKWFAESLQVPLKALTACKKDFPLKFARVLHLQLLVVDSGILHARGSNFHSSTFGITFCSYCTE